MLEVILSVNNRKSETTEFNEQKLISGDSDHTGTVSGSTIVIQTGANAGQRGEINIRLMDLASLGLKDFHNDFMDAINGIADGEVVIPGEALSNLLDTLDAAIKIVSAERAALGAMQNRLEHTIKNLEVAAENLSAAKSRILDTDMVKEMMNLTQANVLQQAAMAMLAQANQAPQSVLQLIG